MYTPISPSPTEASQLVSLGIKPVKGWSSIIGIVTAICGNILISFALNTQRYAHIRLSRDREEYEEKQRSERKRRPRDVTYGTQQSEIAEDRSRANAQSDPGSRRLEDPSNGGETEPLIPSVDSLDKRKFSGSSDESSGKDEKDGSAEQTSYLRSPIWWAGITMMTLGEAGNFLAYGFAPASIVSPLGVVALVSNCLIAPLLLHERFRWRDGVGVIIAVAGCVTVVLSASDNNPKLDPDTIWSLITRWEFETYLGITVFLIIVLMALSNKYGEKTILIDLGLMGLFGGYTALSTKGVASLLSTSIWRVIEYPITYLLLAVLVFTAVMQIKYVNRALQRFNSTQVIPVQFVLFTLSVILGSAVLYRDFERTSAAQAAQFVGGCALTFLGVWAITSGRGDEGRHDEELGEEEDAINLEDEEGVQPEIRERQDSLDSRRVLVAGSSKRSSQATETPRIEIDAPLLTNRTFDLAPANAAAIHSQSTSDLPAEASHDSSKDGKKQQPPPMHATTSLPTVPTIDLSSTPTPRTPMRRGISERTPGTPESPATPRRAMVDQQNLDPSTPQRPPNRHSVSSLLPGPFTSPLSSSLSAIVADSLRRGVDQLPSSSLRRRSFKAGRRRVPDATALKRHSIASGEMDFDEDQNDNDTARAAAGSPTAAGRMRSLSAAVGDMFTIGSSSKRQRNDDRTEDNAD